MTEISGLRHRVLEEIGVAHGFGLRDQVPAADVRRPTQVHGRAVAGIDAGGSVVPEVADAIVSGVSELRIGIVTADCVPILACADDGSVVAAIHAGWRGLGAGIVEAGILALRERAEGSQRLRAVIGPHIGICCYEVDRPVLEALEDRFGSEVLRAAQEPTGFDHARIDLGRLAAEDLVRCGVLTPVQGRFPGVCTACDASRFHSYRRDGTAAGRLLHAIAAKTSRESAGQRPIPNFRGGG